MLLFDYIKNVNKKKKHLSAKVLLKTFMFSVFYYSLELITIFLFLFFTRTAIKIITTGAKISGK